MPESGAGRSHSLLSYGLGEVSLHALTLTKNPEQGAEHMALPALLSPPRPA